MDGLYLYCVREKTEGSSTFQTKGIDGKKGIFTIIHGDLEAVVSRVSLSEFALGETEGKTAEDLNWIREKAMIHEGVIEEAMKDGDRSKSVVPMRFGTVFKGKAGLKETFDRDSARMRMLLSRIQGKEEWSVKIYLMDNVRYELTVREESEEIRSKEKEIASMPEGIAYFMEEELNEAIRKEAHNELDRTLRMVFTELGKGAAEAVKTKILDPEMTGKPVKMVSNAAFLVRADKAASFKRAVEAMGSELGTKGLLLEYSGPWPSYSFTGSCGRVEET
jgi:hypothetical protein